MYSVQYMYTVHSLLCSRVPAAKMVNSFRFEKYDLLVGADGNGANSYSKRNIFKDDHTSATCYALGVVHLSKQNLFAHNLKTHCVT